MDDLEAERRRYFRDRNERKLESEPPGLNLDMATFRRDFPDENPELVDNETDSKGLVVLCNAHRNDHEHEGRIAYMAVGLGVVVPVLLATAVNLYIIIRFTLDPRMVPRILIVDDCLWDSLRMWSQAILGKEFLVEMRLKNHDPNAPQEPAAEPFRR